ncbi:MAG: hypothetical protein KAH57_08595, partial [Thermoplasmata archaeon]|nr:hypothetical protein [Thermoplasmata archaeon]
MIRITSFLIFFLFATMAGWVIDSGYRSIIDKRWTNAGFFIGPFCPIYGFGGLLLLLMVSFLSDLPLAARCGIYFLGMSLVEFVGGVWTTKVLKVRLWDYSDAPMNIMGHIDLLHSFYWLALALLFEGTVWPIIEFLNTTATELAQWVDIAVFTTALIMMAFALGRRMVKERSRVKPFITEGAPPALSKQLEELNDHYEALMGQLDKGIVSPSERSVKIWFDSNEHYLEDINRGIGEIQAEVGRIKHTTAVRHIERDLGDISGKVSMRLKDLNELREMQLGKLEGSPEVKAFTAELGTMRSRVVKRMERTSRRLEWRSYILRRGRSFHPMAFFDRFPAWQSGWQI